MSLPNFSSIPARNPSSSATECSAASLNRSTSWATSLSSICLLGTARSSASSTAVVLDAEDHYTGGNRYALFDLHELPSLLTEFVLYQLHQFLHRRLGIISLGHDLQRRSFHGRQDDH